MNTTIQMSETLYPKSDFRVAGNAITAKVTIGTYQAETESRRDAVYVDVIELALQKVVKRVRANELAAAVVTITGAAGYTLPAGTKTYLTDKYVLQPEIASITFA